jgi:Flp pilus assembly protein TadG
MCVSSTAHKGAGMVETALMLPVLLLLIMAMIEMARMGMANQLLGNAALEGARVAVVPGRTATDVGTTVQNLLNSGGITTYTLTITPPDPTNTTLGDPVTVTISTAFSNISWLSPPLFLGSVTLSASSTLSSEHP